MFDLQKLNNVLIAHNSYEDSEGVWVPHWAIRDYLGFTEKSRNQFYHLKKCGLNEEKRLFGDRYFYNITKLLERMSDYYSKLESTND